MPRFSLSAQRPRPYARLALAAFAALTLLVWALSAAPARCGQEFGDMIWLTEEYYPYNFKDEDTVRGISADLLRLVWKDLGEPEHPIHLQPWARAYKAVLNTPGSILFSMARTSERENLFKWAGPIAHVRFVLNAPKDSGLTIRTLDDLKGLSVGTLRDDVSDRLLDPWRETCKVEPVVQMKQNLLKLEAGRIHMVAYEEMSMRLFLLREGRDPNQYETLFVLKSVPVYFAFHKATDDSLLARFQNSLENVKSSTAYAELLSGYIR